MKPKSFIPIALGAGALIIMSMYSAAVPSVQSPKHTVVVDTSQRVLTSFFAGLPADPRLVSTMAVVRNQQHCLASSPTHLAMVARALGLASVVHAAPPVDCTDTDPLCCSRPHSYSCGGTCPDGSTYNQVDNGVDCSFASKENGNHICNGPEGCPCDYDNSSCNP